MYRIYQVMPDDTLDSIARNLGTTIEELMRLNGNVLLSPGMNIIVPTNSNDLFVTYTVKQGDNMYAIARTYNVDYEDLIRLNGLDKDDYIYPGQEILIPNENVEIYITEEGSTLNDAVARLGTDINNILRQNDTIYLLPDQLIIYKKEKSF
ncbi:MAG: LysM peptidoglycan-binding domain-containing protein [Methanobacteriaceae archaeon]|nr:LysM peptidoglycan-binding domain-containing protein [Methanobacteriaceae archaeon]